MKNIIITACLFIFCFLVSAQKNDMNNSNIRINSEKSSYNENMPYFLQFGIMSKNHEAFKKKYGVAVNYQNCVVSKFMAQKARENNKRVANALTEKFGDNTWKKDLGFIPYGL